MDEFYDWQIPGTWVDIYDDIFMPAMIEEWPARLAEKAAVSAGARVLDVACGTGAWALCAADRVGRDGHVVGLDINTDMLAAARKKQPGPTAAAIDWREASVDAIPFADASFDIVCCQLGLMFFPDQVAALREIRRVLVPGGRMVAMVWGRMEQCPTQMAVAAAWARQFGTEEAAGFHNQHSLADLTKMHELLTAAGYHEIETTWEVGEVRFPTPAHLVRGYAALIGLQVTPPVAEALIADVSASLAAHSQLEGMVCPIETVVATGRNSR